VKQADSSTKLLFDLDEITPTLAICAECGENGGRMIRDFR
jgi:hypothetical protein